MRPLNIGVVGLGKVAQLHHLPNLQAAPHFRIAALCDLSEDLARELARQYGVQPMKVVTDYRSLFDFGLDGIVIANRNHGPIIADALKAALPVFVEKPVCWGRAEGAELLKLAARSSAPVVVGYMKRYDPAVERIIDSGFGAEVIFARVHNFAGGRHRHERLYPVLKGDDYHTDVESKSIDSMLASDLDHDSRRVSAFRTLAELAIHNLNLMSALIGRPELATAQVFATKAGDCFTVNAMHQGRTCIHEVLADFNSPRDWDEQIDLYTKDGYCGLAFPSPFLRNAPTILHQRGSRDLEAYSCSTVASRESPYFRELHHFYDVVTKGVEPRTQLSEAIDDLQLIYEITKTAEFR